MELTLNQIHTLILFSWAGSCLLMGIVMWRFYIPRSRIVKSYKQSVRLLSLNYIVLAVLLFLMLALNLRDSTADVFTFYTLLISLSQALIMSYALISLYAPSKFVIHHILKFNVLPLSALLLSYIVSAMIWNDPVCHSIPDFFSKLNHPSVAMRFILLLFNVYQIILYNALLQKLSFRYVNRLNQYFSDTVQLKPQWARKNFYFAAFFGFLSIVSSLFKDIVIDIWFTILFAVYYVFFALRYMDYNRIFSLLENDFLEELTPVETISTEKIQISTSRKFDWLQAKEQIIQDKLFLKQGITIQHLAEHFNTNRTTFSSCLNKNEKQNFNTFINELRIDYAKKILSEQPQLALSEVALKCGFTEQSNFSRQFRLISGVSPVQWLKNQKHNEN